MGIHGGKVVRLKDRKEGTSGQKPNTDRARWRRRREASNKEV